MFDKKMAKVAATIAPTQTIFFIIGFLFRLTIVMEEVFSLETGSEPVSE